MRASPAYGRNAQREYASRAHGSADEFGRGCSDVLRFGLPGHWLERVTHCRERVTHRRTGTLAVVIAHAAGHRHGHGLGASNQVVICLGANAEAASAPLAMTQANADMARLLASLRRQGVQPADISTTELSLYRGYNEPYQASQSVDVTVHHIANAGTVIAAAMNVVGNDATVSGVTYSIHDPSSEIAAARQAAMANSRLEALQLAQLSGHSLGAVLSVSDELVSSGSSGGCSEGCGGAGGSVPLSPGVDQVSVTIYVTYAMS